MRKRTLLLLCLSLLAGINAFAQDYGYDYEGEGFRGICRGDSCVIYYGERYYTGAIVIPDYVELSFYDYDTYEEITCRYYVRGIDDNAFRDCSMSSVTIGNNVKYIGNEAFEWCSNLASVTIPNSVTRIGDKAFYGCENLSSVTLHCKEIGSWFRGFQSLKEVILGNSVTSIGDNAFEWCSNLTSVTIPNSVTRIGDEAFCYCIGLTSVTIPNSVTSIGEDAFEDCYFSKDAFVNNSTLTDEDNWGAFLFDEETNDGLMITNNVIIGCRNWVTAVTIPENIVGVEEYAFRRNCENLISMTIHCKEIGDYWFCDIPSLEEVILGDEVTSIGEGAFNYCSSLTSVTIGDNVASIGYGVFYDTPWFDGLPEGLVYLGKVAYRYIGEMPEGTEIVIKDGTLGIASGAFEGCTGLTAITIPESITNIGEWAFGGNFFTADAFVNNSSLPYDENWGAIVYDEETDDGLLIQNGVVVNYRGTATSVVIPDNVTRIANWAFSGCSDLTSIVIPNSVTSIGDGAFDGCSGLTSIVIPNSVTSIGEWTFEGCSSLTSVDIPNSVTSIGDWGFRGCSSLTSVDIPNSVTSIGKYAFADCSSLTSIVIPNSVTSIGGEAFWGCSSLTSIVIPNSVTSIGDGAFAGCSGLTSIVIPNSVTSIGGGAFAGCSSLETVYCYVEDVIDIQEYTFGDIDMMNQITLVVPDEAVEGYVTHPVWGEFKIETPTAVISCLKLSPYIDSDITSGFYYYAFLKHGVDAGWHTICLPFTVSNIEEYFGEGAKAYEFCSYADNMLGFSAVTSLVAGYPYILYTPAEITENIMWKNIEVDANDTEAHYINKGGIYFRGSYNSIWGDMWEKESDTDVIYGLTNEGRIARAGSYASINGFSAYFDIPAEVEVKGFRLDDEADAINLAPTLSREEGTAHIYNLAGQRQSKIQKGINIINGKKILK